MKVTYSHSGDIELEKFLKRRKDELERILRRDKYVLGDEQLEITGSDILEAEREFRSLDRPRTTTRLNRLSLLIRMYSLIGIAMLVAGFFYEDIRSILAGDPVQRALVVGGFTFTLISVVASYYVKERAKRRREMENLYLRHYIRSREDIDRIDN